MMFDGLFKQQRARPKFNLEDKMPHYKYQGGKCNGCKKNYDVKDLTVDHIKPLANGGGEKTSNTQLLCGSCNSIKNDGTMKQLEKKLIARGTIKGPAKPTATAATKKKGTAAKPAKKKSASKPKDPFADLFGF